MIKQNTISSLPIALLLAAGCALSAQAGTPSLSAIPQIPGDSNNEGRAITPDGQYIAGLSGTRGFLFKVGHDGATNVLSDNGAQSTVANGIGYRTAPDPNSPGNNRLELIISGMSSGFATEWMTPDGGTTFPGRRRNASDNYATAMGVANQVGSAVGSDQYYVTHYNSNLKSILCLGQGSGQWVATYNEFRKGTSADLGSMNAASASGRSVGWRGTANSQANKRNYMLTYPSSSAFFNGLKGTDSGEPHSVSADGNTVFGRSSTLTDANNYYAFKTTFSGGPGGTNGTTQGAVTPLPEFGDTAGSVTRAVPYTCTADGLYGAGMNYRGQERAVIWDTSNADTNLWTVLDLTDLAKANGFIGDFTLNLRRVYGVATNAAGDLVATGIGYDSSVTARGYVMTVPKWIAAIQFPISQSVNYGSNVVFAVKTNGTDTLTFQWYKNGSVLSGQTGTSISYSGVSCAGGEAGNYEVVINNTAISQVVTGAVTLTVNDPYITTQPLGQTNVIGANGSFTVVAGGAPTLSYQWKLNGNPLSDGPTGNGSTIAGASSANLNISNMQTTDSGTYTVVVTTSAGGCTATSKNANVLIVGRPSLDSLVGDGFGNYTLNVSGPAGQSYRVLYSTNAAAPVTTWKSLGLQYFSGGMGVDTYVDSAPTNSQRFYILASP